MALNVEIAGRMAIPVRAIPCVAGVNLLPPDVVAEMLSQRSEAKTFRTNLSALIAHRLGASGLQDVLPKEWDVVVDSIAALVKILKPEGKREDAAEFVEWRKQSLLYLPADCFVWQDDFEDAFNKDYTAATFGSRGIAGERLGERELNYCPLLPNGICEADLTAGLMMPIIDEADLSLIGVTLEQWQDATTEQRQRIVKSIEATKEISWQLTRQNEERIAQGRYTLEQAAELFEKESGERKAVVLRKLRDAAQNGDLPVYEPGHTVRYEYGPGKDTEHLREFYEEAYWDDLNKWIGQTEPRCKFRFGEPVAPDRNMRPEEGARQTCDRILGQDFLPSGTYPYVDAIRDIAQAQGWDDVRRYALEDAIWEAIKTGRLPTYNYKTGLRHEHGVPRDDLFLLVTPEDVNQWLESRGAAYRWLPAQEATADPKPIPRSQAQDEVIMAALRSRGVDPLSMPPYERGKGGIRLKIRSDVNRDKLFTGKTVFDHAWERLTKNGDIAYKK